MKQPAWGGRAAALVMLGGAALGACHHPTLDGTVRVSGVDPFPEVLLLPAGGGKGIPLAGPPARARVAGLEITAVGRQEGATFQVERFTVVAANEVPATDGRLVDEGGRLYLVTADGARHALVGPPPGLRAHAGKRAWVRGLDREPVAYGIIE
ncbi:MAG: hypothetical protein ACREOC_17195 [Gemmatimonadales bacterium]